MKLPKLLFALLILFTATHLNAEFREFTDQQGRSMKAELINVIGQEVMLKREDGNTFTVSPNIFCEEDKEYIQIWMVQKLNERDSLLTVNARSSETNKKKMDDGLAKMEKWDGYYKVTIENESDLLLQNLKVEYRLWAFHMNMAAQSRDDGKTEIIKKDITIPMIKGRDEFAFDTAKAELSSIDLDSNVIWAGGGKDSSKDKLEGIWIRIYYKGVLIKDWSNPSSLKDKLNWAKLKD